MPLGKILNLLKGVFQNLAAESVNSSELPPTENSSSPATTDNAEPLQENVSEVTLKQLTAETTQTPLPKIQERKKGECCNLNYS